jgi:hypothetical protein
MALVFAFSSCSSDDDDSAVSGFDYPAETLYGTWKITKYEVLHGRSKRRPHRSMRTEPTMDVGISERGVVRILLKVPPFAVI